MAWTKAKTAAACIAALGLLGGTTAIVIQQVAADAETETVTLDPSTPNGDAFLAMTQKRTISGTVRTPDGKPVPDAVVRLRGGAGPVLFTRALGSDGPGRSVTREFLDAPAPDAVRFTQRVEVTPTSDIAPRIIEEDVRITAQPTGAPTTGRLQRTLFKTDAEGTFTLESTDPSALLVAESDAGIAQIPLGAFTDKQDVVLQPWASIEGTLRRGDAPLPNHRVLLNPGDPSHNNPEATTDAQGRFRFDRVPPGHTLLTCQPPANAPNAPPIGMLPLTAKPGETVRLDLGRTGRDVTGRATPPTPTPGTKSQSKLVGLLVRTDRPADGAPRTPLATRQEFAVSPDGSFKLPHVWPGSYTVHIMHHESDGPTMRATTAASATFKIADNDPNTPLDLGTLTSSPTSATIVRREPK